MNRKSLCILLSLCLVLTLVPANVFAASGITGIKEDMEASQKDIKDKLEDLAKNGAPYTVKHYIQDLSWEKGELVSYSLYETEELTGKVLLPTRAEAKDYTGFTAEKFVQVPVLADGSTEVRIYYTRNAVNVVYRAEAGIPIAMPTCYGAEITIDANGGEYVNSSGVVTTKVVAGTETVTIGNPTREGYIFRYWDKLEESNSENFTLKAVWKEATGLTVETPVGGEITAETLGSELLTGMPVYIEVSEELGYKFSRLYYTTADGSETEIGYDRLSGKYMFPMPQATVTVHAVFEKTEFVDYTLYLTADGQVRKDSFDGERVITKDSITYFDGEWTFNNLSFYTDRPIAVVCADTTKIKISGSNIICADADLDNSVSEGIVGYDYDGSCVIYAGGQVLMLLGNGDLTANAGNAEGESEGIFAATLVVDGPRIYTNAGFCETEGASIGVHTTGVMYVSSGAVNSMGHNVAFLSNLPVGIGTSEECVVLGAAEIDEELSYAEITGSTVMVKTDDGLRVAKYAQILAKTKVEITGINARNGNYDGGTHSGHYPTDEPVFYAGDQTVYIDASTLTYTYYKLTLDSKGNVWAKLPTTAENSGAAKEGAAPVNEGTYLLEVAVPESNTLYYGSLQITFTVGPKKESSVKSGTDYDPAMDDSKKEEKEDDPAEEYGTFKDVTKDKYYYEAVEWAAENGLAKGTPEGDFVPNGEVKREELIVFLWRAAGSPVSTKACSFTDVGAASYYYSAVCWAEEAGVIKGVGDGKFDPSGYAKRAEVVTMLAKAAGVDIKNTKLSCSFTDVPKTAYYYGAVSWANAQGIVSGTNSAKTLFSPEATATRAETMMMIYKLLK